MTTNPEADRAVAAVLRQQGGLITRPQAMAAGWTEGTLRHRSRSGGPWRLVLPGIYLSTNGLLAAGQREIAAALYAGPECVLTGLAALQHQGVRVPTTDLVDVLIPASMKRQSLGFVRVHRTTRMPDQLFVRDGIRWAMTARAVADTARGEYDVREVRAVVADAVQRGRCTISQLAEELRAGPKRESGRLREVLEEVADGVRSVAEGEVDSREWHLGAEQFAKTAARHSLMTAHGIMVLHFIPSRVKTEPRQVVAELRSAIETGRRRPRLEIRAVPQVR